MPIRNLPDELYQFSAAWVRIPVVSSLVDLGSSFAVIRQMGIFPVGLTQLINVAIIACLPALPLMFLVLPFMEVLKLLAGVIR